MLITKLARKMIQPKEYISGLTLYKNKEWDKALELFEISIKRKNNHAESYFKAGMCNLKLGMYEEAHRYIEISIKMAPSRTEWKEQLAQCSRHLDKLQDRLMSKSSTEEELLRAKISTEPCNALLYEKLADVLHKKGRWWQEIEALKNAIEIEPVSSDRHFKIGVALEKMSRYGEAASFYKIGISQSKKKEASKYYSLGHALEMESKSGQPVYDSYEMAYAKAISLDKKLESKNFGIGAFHQHKGYWKDAVAAYEKHVFFNPMCAELYYRLGLSYDRCYNWEHAEENYRKALSLNVSKPHWHYRLGFVLERQQKYIEAAISYQYAAQNNSKIIPAWFYRSGITYARAGKFKKSCEMYLEAYKLLIASMSVEHSSVITSDEYLNAYKNRLNHEYRIKTLESAIANKFFNDDLWCELGKTYSSARDWDSAAFAFKESIQRSSTHSSNNYSFFGYSLFKCGRYQQACDAFERSILWKKPYGVPDEILSKNISFRKNSIYTEFYETLDIEKNTILYESFHGASISCNPFALFLEIIKDEKLSSYKHIWVVNDECKIPEEFKNIDGVIFIRRQSDTYMQCLATCEYLINNVSFPEYFIRKTGQKYLNTWHGTPVKFLGKDIKDEFLAHKNVARNFLQTSHLLSPNTHTTDILLQRYDVANLFSGEVKELGYPRIDRTINISCERVGNIRMRLGAISGQKIVLYAPTWRGMHGNATLDIEQLKKDLILLSEQDCCIAFRGHHMTEQILNEHIVKGITVVPSDIDTNELLGVVDILITDYSSIAFDYFVRNKPIIYYAYDMEVYQQERGLYFPLNELPGTVCYNSSELIKTLNDYLAAVNHFDASRGIDKYCSQDDGRVSQRVINWLFSEYKNKKEYKKTKENILFYIGPFMPNGILSSWLNLTAKIDRDKYNISLVVDPKSIYDFEERFEQFKRIAPDIQIIGYCGNMLYSIEDKWLSDKINSQFGLASNEMYDALEHAYRREYLRIFGQSYIDHLIHFEGYNQPWILRFGSSPNEYVKNKVIFQHNDKMSEWKERFPYLEVVFKNYYKFNKIVSVSEQTMILNRDNLSDLFNIERNKFIYCDNVQNPDEVIEKSSDTDETNFSFDKECTYFITLGRLSIEKDQQKLINAFNRLHQVNSNVELLILGDGPLKNDLQRQISDLNLEGVVHLLGRVSNPFPLLKKSDCFVLSSNHEGQPMVLFEAMILNKPIISTDITGSRSALEGRTGMLVDNSEDGLYQGMLDFMKDDLKFESYCIDDYQKNALQMFYDKCLH